jgi:hypothetical protein
MALLTTVTQFLRKEGTGMPDGGARDEQVERRWGRWIGEPAILDEDRRRLHGVCQALDEKSRLC